MASTTAAASQHQASTTVAPASGRKVVDEVSGWLRVMDDGSIDRTWTGPPEALPLMQPVQPYAVPCDGHTLHDLPGEPNLRVYLPEVDAGSVGRLPVIVQLHGGGFCISHPSWALYHHFYARLACAVPAVVVTAELPLAPEQRLPAQIYTGVDVLRRLRSIAMSDKGSLDDPAAELLREAADISRVFLVGDSSGGNLVHLVAARVSEDGADAWAPLRVAGGVPIHPSSWPWRCRRALPRTTHTRAPMGPNAPPLESVPLPPMLVVVGEKDLIHDTNLEYCDALRAAGKDVEVLINRGMTHSFYLNKFAVDMDPTTGERAQELIDAIKSFVARH
ncbi:hypothetical protein ZWY2020_043422 [Hordeum vulgare]|nr:hypothetical protein ZWY2020_043422 [Hordeum vulgare]